MDLKTIGFDDRVSARYFDDPEKVELRNNSSSSFSLTKQELFLFVVLILWPSNASWLSSLYTIPLFSFFLQISFQEFLETRVKRRIIIDEFLTNHKVYRRRGVSYLCLIIYFSRDGIVRVMTKVRWLKTPADVFFENRRSDKRFARLLRNDNVGTRDRQLRHGRNLTWQRWTPNDDEDDELYRNWGQRWIQHHTSPKNISDSEREGPEFSVVDFSIFIRLNPSRDRSKQLFSLSKANERRFIFVVFTRSTRFFRASSIFERGFG